MSPPETLSYRGACPTCGAVADEFREERTESLPTGEVVRLLVCTECDDSEGKTVLRHETVSK